MSSKKREDSAENSQACREYRRLAEEIRSRPPTEAEMAWMLEHEESCPQHDVSSLESELGIPQGALMDGSAELGIPSAAEVIEGIRERLAADRSEAATPAREVAAVLDSTNAGQRDHS